MTTTIPKLSASNFTDPLIQVLGTLSGYQAGSPVAHKETYEPIMDLMGIKAVDEHGYQDPKTKKRPYVSRWIGWAYRNARVPSEDGTEPALTVVGGRGKWALTAEGVTRARELNGVPADAHDAAVAMAFAIVEEDTRLELDKATIAVSAFGSFDSLVEDMTDTGYVPTLKSFPGDDDYNNIVLVRDALTGRDLRVFPDALPTEPRPVPEIGQLGEGVQLPAVADVCYHTDPYVVSLASAQTQCFGSFSPRSGVCGRCKLQGSCLNVVRGKLAQLAGGFQAKLNSPEIIIEDEDEDTDEILAAAHATERRPEWDVDNENSAQIKAASDSVCYRCHEDIPKGSMAWWHREKGLFHDECH